MILAHYHVSLLSLDEKSIEIYLYAKLVFATHYTHECTLKTELFQMDVNFSSAASSYLFGQREVLHRQFV